MHRRRRFRHSQKWLMETGENATYGVRERYVVHPNSIEVRDV
jgi:hypothetical protein